MADDIADRFEARQDRSGPSSRGKGRGRGGGGGGGGRGRGRESDLSHALSRLLRHQAENAGIKLDREGYAPLDRVLQWPPLRQLAPTFAEIQHAVSSSDKQRFALRPNPKTNESLDEDSTEPADWLIRANQGHSIKLESEALLRPIVLEPDKDVDRVASEASKTALQDAPPAAATSTAAITTVPRVLLSSVPVPPVVVHGTYFAFWSSIVASGGLRPMSRTHVHFATGVPEDLGPDTNVISGMRRDAELLIYIDVEQSLRDGAMSWWMSENGVVLTEGVEDTSDNADGRAAKGLVPLKYFKEVVGRKTTGNGQVGVLWRDGVKVADLPEGLKFNVPQGKGGRGGGRGGQRGGRGRGRGRGRG